MDKSKSSMGDRFLDLWARIGGRDGAAVQAALNKGYGEASRAYHNWTHVGAMLSGLDDTRGELPDVDLDAIELAIWFHDVVYDAHAKDNEAQSAALFRKNAGGLEPQLVDHVAALILATASHEACDDPSAQLLLDLDLAILAASPSAYDRYAAAIRSEYAFVPDDLWRTGRTDVLRRFLDRPYIYQTARFRPLETPARDNLAREIAALG